MTAIIFPPPLTIPLVLGLEAWIAVVMLWLAAPIIRRRVPAFDRWGFPLRLAGLALGAFLVGAAVLGEQTPDSGTPNPVARTPESIARGGALYAASCAQCHGVDLRGGGTDAGTTRVPPPSLLSGHLDAHTDGDMYYWISNGLPGGMPAFGSILSETDRWDLVNYLRSLNEAAAADAAELGAPARP